MRPPAFPTGKAAKSPREILIAAGVPCWSGLYAVPALLGRGEHWYLDDAEAREIATATADTLLSLPEAKVKEVLELAKQWGPVLGLLAVLIAATAPRVMATLRLKGARDGIAHPAGSSGPAPAATYAVPGGGNGAAPRAAGPSDPGPGPDGRSRIAGFPFGT